MEEKTINCTIISPMFSYGAYNGVRGKSEFRTSELKGLMRYTYRIACPAESKTLSDDEKRLFGGAAGSGSHHSGADGRTAAEYASPVRLSIREDGTSRNTDVLLLHGKRDRNPALNYIASGDIQIIARMSCAATRRAKISEKEIGLDWYTDLITLALTLFGLGKRSRKGRGNVAVQELTFTNKAEAAEWICRKLNRVAKTSEAPRQGDLYTISGQGIYSKLNQEGCKRLRRPLIRRIEFGGRLDQEQVGKYLRAIDKASHDTKCSKVKKDREKQATGWAGRGERLASPLIVSLMRTVEGIYPVYTFVHAVLGSSVIDEDLREREEFVRTVEKYFKEEVKG
ncbi:RAMP superfamily CRISPR-associated protein [Bacilliculturomica massiliensis]|uniref:RAMP superfamily CRISPR-associated protein n=1 Tax=Bacilliculturomica massiliensis TaxID=1917867 RepID=UPI0010309D5B|nr:RAMP superfamily CRISPR-associated protein [Bacilliculturomica massiliensis]